MRIDQKRLNKPQTLKRREEKAKAYVMKHKGSIKKNILAGDSSFIKIARRDYKYVV